MSPPKIEKVSVSILGQAIRYYRELKRWSVGQLSRYSNVSGPHILEVENGKRAGNMRQSTLEKIANALDVRVEDLINFNPHKLAEPKPEYSTEGTRRHQLFQRLNQLSDEQLEALENFLELILNRGNHEEPQ